MLRRHLTPFAVLVALVLLGAAAAEAQTKFSMTGKYGQKRGFLVNIPLVGITPCPGHTHRMNLFTTATMTPIMTTPPPPGFPGYGVQANPAGCVPASTPTTPGGTMGASVFGSNPAGFTVPVGAFQQPFPGALNVVPIPITAVQQLATSWAVTGPAASPASPLNALKANGTNTAPWRRFQKSAWMTQSGRAGPNFTACWGFDNPATLGGPFATCNYITTATAPIISKYTGGPDRFGGTMGLVLQAGPSPASLAIVQASGIPPGGVLMQPIAGMGSALGGKGYLDVRGGGAAGSAFIFSSFMATGTMQSGVITAVGNLAATIPHPGGRTALQPFTTGTVLARQTGKNAAGVISVLTLTAMGNDARTAMGAGNITLVSGGMGVAPGASMPSLDIMSLSFVPEPSAAILLVAGSLGLFGLDRVRVRRRR